MSQDLLQHREIAAGLEPAHREGVAAAVDVEVLDAGPLAYHPRERPRTRCGIGHDPILAGEDLTPQLGAERHATHPARLGVRDLEQTATHVAALRAARLGP